MCTGEDPFVSRVQTTVSGHPGFQSRLGVSYFLFTGVKGKLVYVVSTLPSFLIPRDHRSCNPLCLDK